MSLYIRVLKILTVVLEYHDICPFCGGKPIKKNPLLDRITKVRAGGGASQVSAHGSVEMNANPQKEEYYLCNGCNQKYVWAPIDIDLIIKHLDAEENIAKLIYHYYKDEVMLTDLLTKYRTGIVRKHSDNGADPSTIRTPSNLYFGGGGRNG